MKYPNKFNEDDEITGEYEVLPEEIIPTKKYKTPGTGIIKRCPACEGSGKQEIYVGSAYSCTSCPGCNGTGILKG